MEQAPIAEAAQMPQAAPMAEPEGDMGGYTVCIAVAPDGQMSVGVEGGEMRPAADNKEALTMALEILKNEGKVMEDEGDAQFAAGYQSRGGMA